MFSGPFAGPIFLMPALPQGMLGSPDGRATNRMMIWLSDAFAAHAAGSGCGADARTKGAGRRIGGARR